MENKVIKRYRLLRDAEYGKKGSIWERVNRGNHDVYIQQGIVGGYCYCVEFVEQTDWFEEVKELKREFTLEDMRTCFNEARLTHPMVGFKYDTFEDYFKP